MITFGNGFRVRRETAAQLGGQFGPDGGRSLIVQLAKGDVINLWPKGTRQVVTVAAVDVYRYAIRCKANAAALERARVVKERKAIVREQRSIQRAERRLIAI